MFCTREAFAATGGFDERFFWAEEGTFALALKREGRFAVIWPRVITSGRRFRTMTWRNLFSILARWISSPVKIFTNRSSVEKIWYDSNRANDNRVSTSPLNKIINAFLLVIILVVLSEPVWSFVPWRFTPLASPLGKIRFVIGVGLCHIALFFWPVAAILFVNLLRQKRCTGLIQSIALISFLVWQCLGATQGVIWFWTQLGRKLIG
jgi:hypothetical protein